MAVVLEIENLSVSFAESDFRLEPMSFSVESGEILSIVGESGCGKSTLARAMTGLIEKNGQVSGNVLINGNSIYAVTAGELERMRSLQFSIAFQNSGNLLNPLLTVGEQIREVIRKKYTDRREIERRILELLELFSLDISILNQKPAALSGGMTQKVLILMAIALFPRLVFLDEPTSSLDINSRDQLIRLIKKINEQYQITFVVITHDFGVAQEISSRMMVLYQGKLVEMGKTQDMLETPLHPYTRGLINSSMDIYLYRDIWGIKIDKEREKTEGCPFFSRCPQHLEECRYKNPSLSVHKANKERVLACNRGGIVTVLEARNISKSYGKKQVLDHVTIRIQSAEVISLIGMSGSGKSTLAGIVAGYLDKDEGEILYYEKEIDFGMLHRSKKGLQMIFQDADSSLNPSLMIWQAVIEPLYLYDRNDKNLKETARRFLLDVGLPGDELFLNRKIKTLSGGQKQRVAVARALVMEPDLIVADEITSMLDASTKANLIRTLKAIQNKKGFSMLFITHDLSCAMKISDKIYVMNSEGKLSRSYNHSDLQTQLQ